MDHHIDQTLLMVKVDQHSGVMVMVVEQIKLMHTGILLKMLMVELLTLIRLYQKVLAFNLKIKMTRLQQVMDGIA